MRSRLIQKWRPPLVLVLGGTLSAVLLLPIIAIGYFRVAGNILGWGETAGVVGGVAIVSTLLLSFLLWRLVLRPVAALTRYAQSIAKGDNPLPPPAHFGTPEFMKLGTSVREMGRVLQGREAAVRTYADHVTHELRSPLTVLRGAAELLSDDALPAADRRKLLDRIETATARMGTLIDAQRDLARAQDPLPDGTCQLSTLLLDLQKDHPKARITIAENSEIPLPEQIVRLVLDHLIENATSHDATTIALAARMDALTVADNGSGISAGNRARIFDPFFTTRRDSGGTGMGLAIVKRMLEAHGAEIALADSAETLFEIRF